MTSLHFIASSIHSFHTYFQVMHLIAGPTMDSRSPTLTNDTLVQPHSSLDVEKSSMAMNPLDLAPDTVAHSQLTSTRRRSLVVRGVLGFCKLIIAGRNRIFGCKPSGLIRVPRIRSLGLFDVGYPNLAAFKDSSDCFMVYRRFGYLQARVILDKQDELRRMEEELDAYDRDNPNFITTTSLPDDHAAIRRTLLERIERTFNAYATLLIAAQQIMSFRHPSNAEYTSVHNYLDNMNPIHPTEQSYIAHKEDLVTLRPGREHAWLDRGIEFMLRKLQKPVPWFTSIFRSQETRLKYQGGDIVYFSPERINVCATSIILVVILALLMVPIYSLYHLLTVNHGVFTGQVTATCIGILLISTLAFSAALSLFTRAKRHEILGAAAAYCAVLVVFLGNVR